MEEMCSVRFVTLNAGEGDDNDEFLLEKKKDTHDESDDDV